MTIFSVSRARARDHAVDVHSDECKQRVRSNHLMIECVAFNLKSFLFAGHVGSPASRGEAERDQGGAHYNFLALCYDCGSACKENGGKVRCIS